MEKKNSMALFVDKDEEYEFLEISEEEGEVGLSLSHWEFIGPSDFDSEEDEKPTEEKAEPEVPEEEGDRGQIEPQLLHFQDYDDHHDHDDVDHPDDDDAADYDYDYDYDDYDAYGLDDELVPWSVSGKFGRQRMRKLGKRGFTKMYNSKRSPYLFVRPGVVRGKHGLGLKHSL